MNNKKVFTRKITNYKPEDEAYTTIVDCGHIKEVKVIERVSSNLLRYKKVDKYHYCDKVTGEVFEYKRDSSNRHRNFRKTFEKLRCIINTNFKSEINELHVTLTYTEKMLDFDRASKDFKIFWGKLHYRYPDLEYIKIIEPHKTGAWHIHVLLKTSKYKYLFIPNNELDKMWGKGNVNISKIENNDNLGAYFTPRLKEIDAFEEDLEDWNERKCIVKGARLHFYPANKRFYGYSNGIKKPVRINVSYSEAKEILNFDECVYESAHEVVTAESENNTEKVINHYLYMQFNSKRKNKGQSDHNKL